MNNKKTIKKPLKTPKEKRELTRRTSFINSIKGFFKELKRVRWPNSSVAWKTFWVTILFVVVASLVLFLITLGFTTLWEKWGVGL